MPQREIATTASGELVEFCEAVAAAGFDHVLFYDHVLGADTASRPGWSGVYSLTDPFLEPLVTFGYLAQATTLDFMTGVLVLPQRQTVLVAKQVATLEALGPGARPAVQGRLKRALGLVLVGDVQAGLLDRGERRFPDLVEGCLEELLLAVGRLG